MAKVQLRARSVLGFVLVGVAAVGCGGQRAVGDPMPPTASQMQAVAQATASIDQFSSIKANPQNALAIQGQLGALGSLAVDPSRRQALNGDGAGDLGPSAEPPACITGSVASGWTYNNCTSGSATINGTVKVSGDTVSMDLTVNVSGSGEGVSVTLKGSVTVTATTISGQMVYETKVSGASFPGVAGASTKTTVTYDATYTSNPVCISSGSIRVDVEGAYSGAALFEWTGCNMYTVRNG